MIVHICVAERDPKHALADEGCHLVLDQVRAAPVREAGRKASDQVDRPIGRPEQQRSGIRGDRAAIECRLDLAALDRCKTEEVRATLCEHRGAPPNRASYCCTTTLTLQSPDAPLQFEKSALGSPAQRI